MLKAPAHRSISMGNPASNMTAKLLIPREPPTHLLDKTMATLVREIEGEMAN